MTKMNLGSSDTQASTTASVTSTRIASYESAISALESFVGESSLKGNAYSSAKTYASSVLIPLLKAAALYSEGVATGTNKIPSEYRNTGSYPTINGESPLDSATLEEELKSLDSTVTSLTTSLQNAKPGSKGYDSVNTQLTTATERRDKVIKQLAELASYDSASAGFYSNLADLETNLSTGLGQVTSAMSNFKGKFTVPKSKDMAWAGTTNKLWNQRQKLIDHMESGKPMDESILGEVSDYLKVGKSGEKKILVYDNLYGYAFYTISWELSNLNKNNSDKIFLTAGQDNKVKGGANYSTISLKNRTADGKQINTVEKKDDKTGYTYGQSFASGIGSSGLNAAYTKYSSKDGRKVATTVESGLKENNGRLAIYQKTSEMTSVSGKMKDIPVTVAVTSGSERGLYINPVNPTGFAPVTNQVREFDWEQHERAEQFAKNVTITAVTAGVGALAWPAVAALGSAVGAYMLGTAVATAISAVVVSRMEKNDDSNKPK